MVIPKPLGKLKEQFFDGFSGRYRNLSNLKHDKNIRYVYVVVEIWNHNLLISCKPFRWKTWQFWKYDLETCVTCCDIILTPHLVMHLIAAWGVLLTIANFSMFPAGTKTWHRKKHVSKQDEKYTSQFAKCSSNLSHFPPTFISLIQPFNL